MTERSRSVTKTFQTPVQSCTLDSGSAMSLHCCNSNIPNPLEEDAILLKLLKDQSKNLNS